MLVWNICEIIWAMDIIIRSNLKVLLIPVAARSKAWVCGRSLAGIAGLSPASSMGV